MIRRNLFFIIPGIIIILGSSFAYVVATSYQPAIIYQSTPNAAYLPYQALNINGTNPPPSTPILYADCSHTRPSNCQLWIDRKPNNGGEIIFGCGQQEEFALFERYHGTLNFAQRTNSTAYAYLMEMTPAGDTIHWGHQFYVSKQGNWGYMQPDETDGLMHFVKSIPKFPTTLGC